MSMPFSMVYHYCRLGIFIIGRIVAGFVSKLIESAFIKATVNKTLASSANIWRITV